MATAADLYALQETDLAVDTRKSRLADIEDQLGETEELIASREAVVQRREALRLVRERQKDLDWQVDEVRSKAAGIEKKLYAGSIRNPKELEDLQQDLQSIQRQVRSREDELLSLMLEVDEAEHAFRSAEATLAALEARWKEEQASLESEKKRLETELAELEGRRANQTNGVEPGLLRLYDTLRARRQGKAVAKVERGMCQGCRITLPMSILQKARAGLALVQCVSCERILYVS